MDVGKQLERGKMDIVNFIETTEIDERAIRRLAGAKGCKVAHANNKWNYCGVSLDDDEVWSVLNSK